MRYQRINLFIKLALCLLGFYLITGCWYGSPLSNMNMPVQQQFAAQPFAKRKLILAQLVHWQLEGSFSIRQQQQLPIIANYEWQQAGIDHYQININAPLNLMSAVIIGQPGWVSLRNSQGQTAQAPSAEQLMQTTLGWSLPISDLWFWIRGLPAETVYSNLYFDQFGHLTALQQDGWLVRINQYQSINGIDLPQEIELQRPGLFVKIIAKSWTIVPMISH